MIVNNRMRVLQDFVTQPCHWGCKYPTQPLWSFEWLQSFSDAQPPQALTITKLFVQNVPVPLAKHAACGPHVFESALCIRTFDDSPNKRIWRPTNNRVVVLKQSDNEIDMAI